MEFCRTAKNWSHCNRLPYCSCLVFKTLINTKKNIMRKSQIILLFLVAIPVLFFSCAKETNDKLDQLEKFYRDNPESIAQVKFVHAYTPLTINGLTAGTTTSGVGFRITMDGGKINGATNTSTFTNTFVYGGVYPPTTAYAFLPPGGHNFRFVMNRITAGNFAPIAGDEVFNSTVELKAGKKFSMFIADPYAPPSTLMIEDNFTVPAVNGYAVRFINLCADAASRFDVVSKRYGTKLFSNVGFREMKDYIYLNTTTTDTMYLYNAGTSTLVSQVNSFTPGPQRVYTFYARGKTGTTGRTPNLTFYTNR